jgi:hypothetical protein
VAGAARPGVSIIGKKLKKSIVISGYVLL